MCSFALAVSNLRSWWFKSVAVFKLKDTSSLLAEHLSVAYMDEYPLPAHSLILNWSESNCWSESKTCFKYKV